MQCLGPGRQRTHCRARVSKPILAVQCGEIDESLSASEAGDYSHRCLELSEERAAFSRSELCGTIRSKINCDRRTSRSEWAAVVFCGHCKVVPLCRVRLLFFIIISSSNHGGANAM